MRPLSVFLPFLLIILAFSVSHSQDLRPVFAGQFYPAQKDELQKMIKDLFARAVQSKGLKGVAAIITPHAGYVFSGEVAAASFNQIDAEKDYDNIFVIASSHRVAFEGAAVYAKGDLLTPLGRVSVNKELGKALLDANGVFVDRSDAFTQEHSLEVQLPFLQTRLKKDFRIVPIVIGAQDPSTCRKIADGLKPYFKPENLFVVSTDFSHYPSARDAANVDAATAQAIATNSSKSLLRALDANEQKGIPNLATSLCGWSSVLTLVHMTEGRKEAQYHLVSYMNSGDSPYGGKDEVVGYHAIAVTTGDAPQSREFKLSSSDKKALLTLARSTLTEYLTHQTLAAPDGGSFSDALRTPCGAFVTLQKEDGLRGCIGRFEPGEELCKVVQEMAIAAAVNDYRFPPVTAGELPDIEIEISVLTPLKLIKSIDEFTLGKHGIYIRKGGRSGTFLPQVAEETGWSKEEFLGHCARDKAGIGWDGWKEAELYVYEAIVFSEKEPEGHR